MKTKRNIIAIISSLLLLTVIGFAFAIIKHDKGEFVDNSSTTRSYVGHLYQTIPELTSDLDYYTIARRQVIYYFTEGLTDKDKLIHEVLKILVCKLEVEGTEYDMPQSQIERYEDAINRTYQSSLFMKELIESKGLDYSEVIKSRCQIYYQAFINNCVMQKWGDLDKDSISGSGVTGQELLEQYNELQDKKAEQLHKVMNKKYHFDRQIEELFVEIFGKDYEHKKFDAWYRKELEKVKPSEQTTIRYVETTTSLDDRFGTVFPTRERGHETKTQSAD